MNIGIKKIMRDGNSNDAGKLYIVGTPIGNLGDLSPRAKEILADADFIAAEDTRVTLKLLTRFGIRKPLISCREHNIHEAAELIYDRVLSGENCALVTDAGMPCISDPGEVVVRLFAERGAPVTSVPGPSALVTALSVSGLPSKRFSFEGFLPVNKRGRLAHLRTAKTYDGTLIFYEAPHKLAGTMRDLAAELGFSRNAAVIRELTKIHEEVRRGTLEELAAHYSSDSATIKGEFVIVVSPPVEEENVFETATLEQAAASARELMNNGHSASDAAKLAAKDSGFNKSDIYRELMKG